MTTQPESKPEQVIDDSRRNFLDSAGKAAAVAPAVALLLAAQPKGAIAQTAPYENTPPPGITPPKPD